MSFEIRGVVSQHNAYLWVLRRTQKHLFRISALAGENEGYPAFSHSSYISTTLLLHHVVSSRQDRPESFMQGSRTMPPNPGRRPSDPCHNSQR